MSISFQSIAVVSRQRGNGSALEVLETLIAYLKQKNRHIIIEQETAILLGDMSLPHYAMDELGEHCELIIVVGGDGSLLQAAQAAVRFDRPVLGINRGYLGFLADISPHELESGLGAILEGEYQQEQRFLLNAIVQSPKPICKIALNDVVLLPGQVAHMIEFEIFIDQKFVCRQRADGLIVATPTGSTAYALSGGGPILHPDLDAIVLVPMFPHKLTSRPIVVSGDSQVTLHIVKSTTVFPRLSCDGQAHIELEADNVVVIEKKLEKLKLIHPVDYDYFDTLRTKLHWETK